MWALPKMIVLIQCFYCNSLRRDDSYTYSWGGRCRPPGGVSTCNDGYHFNMSINLETKQQQSYTLRNNAMIRDVNSTLSPDQSVLNFCSTATRLQRRRSKSRLLRSTLPRPVYESSFLASEEIYLTSHKPAIAWYWSVDRNKEHRTRKRAICMRQPSSFEAKP